MRNWKSIAIVVLLAVVIWFGAAIVRLENYRYAASLVMCDQYAHAETFVQHDRCLDRTETRTNWAYHLLYGLGIL